MGKVAKSYQDELVKIKKDVKNAYEANQSNYDRFNEFRRFIFDSSLTGDDITLLNAEGKPAIEFNISEAYISRLMGEFSKQEPSVAVGAEDEDQADPTMVHVVEGHMQHTFRNSKNYNTRWEIMKDLYSGGFSTGKVLTDYRHPMSMDQDIMIDRCFDPCLTGFDQTARLSHKGDGRFCFELFPYECQEFEDLAKEHGWDVDIKKLSFSRQFSAFNWTYLNGNIKIVLVCDYYKKKKRRVKILRLSNNRVVTEADYKLMQDQWEAQGQIAQLPQPIGKSRWTTIETVCRYRCIENEVLEYEETDYTFFPLINFSGNSIWLKNPKTSGAVQEMTRPYTYHAMGAQKLKNYAGITLANELENMTQSKFMVAKEALPKEEDWLDAYTNPQSPNNMVFNAFYENNPEQAIPNPIMPVPRVPAPPEVVQAFTGSDSLIQNILGSYDAALGINDNQLSGVAIIEAATQSNAAAMPYVVGFLQGLQRMAEIILDLIPKYYTTPRTIPVMGKDNEPAYVKINQPDGVHMEYDVHTLNVSVTAGVSFGIQKSRALQQLIAVMGVSKRFDEFMNDKGLPTLLDNLEIRGIDQLKMGVEDWLKEQDQMKQVAMQQQQQEMQNNPQVLKAKAEMAKIQQKGQQDQAQNMLDAKRLQLDEQNLQNAQIKILADMKMTQEANQTQRLKAEAERYSKGVELAMKRKDMLHTHVKDAIGLHHSIAHANKVLSQPPMRPAQQP